jgi:hypothetical protein
MARLAAAFAVTDLAPFRWLVARRALMIFRAALALAGTGRWFGGVARAAADPLLQIGQFGRQGGEFAAEFIVLLPGEPESRVAERG